MESIKSLDYSSLDVAKRTFTFSEALLKYPDFEKHYIGLGTVLPKGHDAFIEYISDNGLGSDVLDLYTEICEEIRDNRTIYTKGILIVYLSNSGSLERATEEVFLYPTLADKFIKENSNKFEGISLMKVSLV